MNGYRPKLRSSDISWSVTSDVGSYGHCTIIDVLLVLRGPEEETIFALARWGYSQREIGQILGLPEYTIGYRYRDILDRAKRRTLPKRSSREGGPALRRVVSQVRHSDNGEDQGHPET